MIGALGALAAGENRTPPLPGLPPEPRPLQLEAAPTPRAGTPRSAPEHANVGADLEALRRAVERVRSTLGAAAPAADHAASSIGAESVPATAGAGPLRPGRSSDRFTMAVRPIDGGMLVTADIRGEHLEAVYRELATLIGRAIDDSALVSTQRLVDLRISDLPWGEALDRLLGQVGLGWRQEGSGTSGKLVLHDLGRGGVDPQRRTQLAQQALRQAQTDRTTAYAAEASFLMGVHAARAGHRLEAVRLYTAVVEEFDPVKDPAFRPWVLRAIRGIADEMMELQQYHEARSVYHTWLTKAGDDRELATVLLRAARAGILASQGRQDPLVADEAADALHDLLQRFANDPAAAREVAEARRLLGEQLFAAKRYAEAEAQLKLYAASLHTVTDQVGFWLAECAFHSDRLSEARPVYERLYRAWRSQQAETGAAPALYATAAFRIGQCHLKGKTPQPVQALFAFLRAHQDFPKSGMEIELLVAIARCYAELERDEEMITALWQLLKADAIADNRPGALQIDQLLGDLEGSLPAYPGPVRARVLFHIATANYRHAVRDRRERERLVGEAIFRFERVIAERPPSELLHAAQLGLARVALLAGQHERAERLLADLLRDGATSGRDRDFAGQLLGNHLREQGKLREAIKAYRGEAE